MKTLLSSILICVSCVLLGQGDASDLKPSIRKNAFYLELGGNGFYYSVNYDRIFSISKIAHLSLRAGFAASPEFGSGYNSYVVPLEANLLLGKENDFFELGVGKSIISERSNNSENISTFRLGYRYISDKGLMIRIGIVPFILPLFGNDVVVIWGGLSVGFSF
tara:strand:- start:5749 stop:6237 length:489 start_codon:yes stop_codon:yes gene_type:complete